MKHRLWIVFLFSLVVCVACQHSGKEDMRLRLDYVSRCNRADTVFTEAWLPRVDSLVSYFDRHGNANERMMAHYLQGRVYHDMGEAPQALECYQTATEQADTTREDCDLHTLAAIYGQMADLYHSQYLPDDEMESINKAEHFAWKNRDTLTAIIAYRLRTRVYHLRCDTDSMLYITNRCIDRYRTLGHKDFAAQLFLVPISVCLDRGQYKEAWKYMQIHENESGYFDDKGNAMPGKELYYYYKGKYFLSQNQTDDAISCFMKAIRGGFLEAGYKGLLAAYEQKRNPDSISKYAKLYAVANDSTFMNVNQKTVHQISAQYKYNRHLRIAQENKLKATYLRMYLLLVILLFITILSIYAFFENKRRMKSIFQINQLLSTKKELQTILKEKQKQIETISEEKDSVIQKISQENTKLLERHLDEQEQLIEEIEHLNNELKNFSSAEIEKAFSKTAIGQYFQSIRDSNPKHPSPSALDWTRFTKTFREHFHYYFTFITDGNRLSTDQLRVCMMLRLNYHEYEMAHFMNVDKQRINRVKQQVNKKLFGELNSINLRSNLRKHF